MSNSAERLCSKIKLDAQARAESILAEARAEAESAMSETRERSRREAEEYLDKVRKSAEREAARRISVGELDMRNELLRAKQELIDSAFNQALKTLCEMDGAQYEKILLAMVAEAASSGRYRLVLASNDRERLGDRFVDIANEELKKRGRDAVVELAEYSSAIPGGFLLQGNNVEYDYSFGSILANIRDEIESEVVAALFGDEKSAV